MSARDIFGSSVLCPIDVGARSERAAELAGWFAARIGADVQLVSVVVSTAELAIRQRYLDTIAEAVSARTGVTVRAVACRSDHIERELGQALDGRTSVVMATSASRLPHGGHFGSIADHVVRTAKRPVMLIGPQAQAALGDGPIRVVLPVDGSELAERAVPVAAALAAAIDLPLSVITVRSAAATETSAIAEAAYVRELADRLAATGLATDHHVIHDSNPAAAVIAGFAGGATISVMASHGRTGLSRLVAGSVTTQVVRTAAWPVVVIPPNA